MSTTRPQGFFQTTETAESDSPQKLPKAMRTHLILFATGFSGCIWRRPSLHSARSALEFFAEKGREKPLFNKNPGSVNFLLITS